MNQENDISPSNNYERVMNLKLNDEIMDFKHISGEEYGLFTNLKFTYYASNAYFEVLENHKDFIKSSEWNKSFNKKKCYIEEVNKVCYEGVVFPYVHNLIYNEKTKFIQHSVTGMSD